MEAGELQVQCQLGQLRGFVSKFRTNIGAGELRLQLSVRLLSRMCRPWVQFPVQHLEENREREEKKSGDEIILV